MNKWVSSLLAPHSSLMDSTNQGFTMYQKAPTSFPTVWTNAIDLAHSEVMSPSFVYFSTFFLSFFSLLSGHGEPNYTVQVSCRVKLSSIDTWLSRIHPLSYSAWLKRRHGLYQDDSKTSIWCQVPRSFQITRYLMLHKQKICTHLAEFLLFTQILPQLILLQNYHNFVASPNNSQIIWLACNKNISVDANMPTFD